MFRGACSKVAVRPSLGFRGRNRPCGDHGRRGRGETRTLMPKHWHLKPACLPIPPRARWPHPTARVGDPAGARRQVRTGSELVGADRSGMVTDGVTEAASGPTASPAAASARPAPVVRVTAGADAWGGGGIMVVIGAGTGGGVGRGGVRPRRTPRRWPRDRRLPPGGLPSRRRPGGRRRRRRRRRPWRRAAVATSGLRRDRSSTARRMAVRLWPSMRMSAKVGMQTRSRFEGATKPRAMAMALMAWLRAPAPTTWTSTAPVWRNTPARAPATEFGFDLLETFKTSTTCPPIPSCALTVRRRPLPFLPAATRP